MSFSVDKLQRPKNFDSDVPLIQVVFKVSSDAKYQNSESADWLCTKTADWLAAGGLLEHCHAG